MKRILVFAAHPDDEFLGCGATLLKFKKKGFKIKSFFLEIQKTYHVKIHNNLVLNSIIEAENKL